MDTTAAANMRFRIDRSYIELTWESHTAPCSILVGDNEFAAGVKGSILGAGSIAKEPWIPHGLLWFDGADVPYAFAYLADK